MLNPDARPTDDMSMKPKSVPSRWRHRLTPHDKSLWVQLEALIKAFK
jgi:hypothetical protein